MTTKEQFDNLKQRIVSGQNTTIEATVHLNELSKQLYEELPDEGYAVCSLGNKPLYVMVEPGSGTIGSQKIWKINAHEPIIFNDCELATRYATKHDLIVADEQYHKQVIPMDEYKRLMIKNAERAIDDLEEAKSWSEDDPKKKCYLSLPISGRDRQEAMDCAEGMKGRVEEKHGYDVVTPFDLTDQSPGDNWQYYLGKDIEGLLHCDAIVLCPGWENSKGCQLELFAARLYGKEIILIDVHANIISLETCLWR